MSPSKILFFLCISFISGIFLESITRVPQVFLWAFLVFGILLIFTSFLFHRWFIIAGFCILFLIFGILRAQISEFNITNNKLSKLNGRGEIVLTGIISAEPDVRENSQKIKVLTEDSVILVTTGRYPEYKYLDEIKITGKLETPMETEDFSYKDYLQKDHIYSVMGFPKAEIIGKARGSIVSMAYSWTLELKQKLRQRIQNNFLPPQSLILRGIILGDKSAVGQDIKDKFRITGLSHVIAVSGMHVAILSAIIMSFLLFLGLWRKQAFCGAVIFIFIYVVMIGLPSSAIRAVII